MTARTTLASLAQRTPLDGLERNVVHAVLPDLLRQLENIRSEAREGRAGLGPGDPAKDLALILGHHPGSVPMKALMQRDTRLAVSAYANGPLVSPVRRGTGRDAAAADWVLDWVLAPQIGDASTAWIASQGAKTAH